MKLIYLYGRPDDDGPRDPSHGRPRPDRAGRLAVVTEAELAKVLQFPSDRVRHAGPRQRMAA